MAKRKHEYCSATSGGALDQVLEPSKGVKKAEQRHTRQEIKHAIRQGILRARSTQRG